MSKITDPKIISISTFKSKNPIGDIAKFRVATHDNGVVLIEKRVLCNKPLADSTSWIVVTERFGKTLYTKCFSLKYGSLHCIMNIVSKALIDNKIPPSDILI